MSGTVIINFVQTGLYKWDAIGLQKIIFNKSNLDAEKSYEAEKYEELTFQPTITIDFDKELNLVASQLIAEYLSYHMDDSIPRGERVKDFKIKDIHILKETDLGFIFIVRFSVQGVIEQTAWRTGNGMVKDNGWIEYNYMFVNVVQSGNSFTMIDWNMKVTEIERQSRK